MRSFFFWLAQEVSIFSWGMTIALDLFWNVLEGMSIFSGVGVICYPFIMTVIFGICFLTVALMQRYLSGDEWRPALRKGAILGAFAAIPFSVVSLIAGAIAYIVNATTNRDYAYSFGKLGLNYRELEKVIKHAALSTGLIKGNWREISMETAINTLERAGKISEREAQELHRLRIARNAAHHEETPSNLSGWVNQSEQQLQKYSRRFGVFQS